jgi:hypothetical protein
MENIIPLVFLHEAEQHPVKVERAEQGLNDTEVAGEDGR